MASKTHIFNNGPEEAAMHPGEPHFAAQMGDAFEVSATHRCAVKCPCANYPTSVPWVSTLARHPDSLAYTWRLAGTGLCETWGRPLTGRAAFARTGPHSTATPSCAGWIRWLA
jgi:hypothetical protein